MKKVEAILVEMSGLRFVTDNISGITRKRFKDTFHFIDADGNRIKDELEIKRIRSLAIPPAWTNVWICAFKNGHIQATGRDAKLRKQYRYHPLWRENRDESKYQHMISFGKALPVIRQAVNQALSLPGLPQEKVLATVIYLMQLTMIRIGNDTYAKQNQSYGLTTLRNKHIQVNGSQMCFHFKGKSGVEHHITVSDRKMALLVKKIRDLPGQELFQYIDDDGKRHAISSSEVNAYIRSITGEDFTAKDFRTWYGTIEAAIQLLEFEAFTSDTQAKHNITDAIKMVAKKLGNTPTICRKCYVHPAVIDAYLNGTLTDLLPKLMNKKSAASPESKKDMTSVTLSAEEEAILEFLQLPAVEPA